MSLETDKKLEQAGNAVDIRALADYEYDINKNDTDTIDFGSEIDASEVITFDSKTGETHGGSNESEQELAKKIQESTDTGLKPVRHQESTLLVDSPLLELKEEMAGERVASDKSSHHYLVFFMIFAGLLVLVVAIAISLQVAETDGDYDKYGNGSALPGVSPRGEGLTYHMAPISGEPRAGDYVINGVALNAQFPNPEDRLGVQLVDEVKNTLIVYADGYVPYTISVDPDRDFVDSPLSYLLESSDTYQKSNLTIRAPKGADLSKSVLYVNGKSLIAKPEQTVEVVSGFPVFIQLSDRNDKGDHLHVVWPTQSRETVQLPELESIDSARRVTVFKISVPKDYTRDESFQLLVTAEGTTTTVAGTRRLAKNEMIEIKMNKKGRYPFEMMINSTPFGSITIEGYMQLSSRGIAKVRFGKKSLPNTTLCFRRSSESICAHPDQETIVPSGRWELVAYETNPDGSKSWFTNSTYETISEDVDYVFTLKSKEKIFSYEMAKPGRERSR